MEQRNAYLSPNSNGNGGRNDGSRPVSLYDNFSRENDSSLERQRFSTSNRDEDSSLINSPRITSYVENSPSFSYSLTTTVPQNIKGANIAGKHAPTRNSLRHSRMIVMNRTGKVPQKSQPPIIRFHKLAKALVGFQILFGTLLCFLALWFFLWAPHIRTRDNPFWSALPLLLSGFFGVLLLCCCRKEYPGMPLGYCIYSIKVVSVILSTIAGAAGIIASIFALIHLISLYSMTCAPKDRLNETCVCSAEPNSTIPIKTYHYVDLSCPEVDNVLTILLIFSAVVNLLAGIISVWYMYLHWASRYMYAYSKVRTKELSPMVISNN